MDEATAQRILYAIAAVGAVVWLFGLQFLVASFRSAKRSADVSLDDRFEPMESRSADVIRGSGDVAGIPAELAARAASALAAHGGGQLKIIERSDDRVVFEGVRASARGKSAGQYVRRGELRFRRLGGEQTRVEYEIEPGGGRLLLKLGVVFQLLGLVALLAGFWLIRTYVASNPDPAVRGQTFQMFQVVHFLWPPFVFGGVYRKARSTSRSQVEVLIHNLPYHGDR